MADLAAVPATEALLPGTGDLLAELEAVSEEIGTEADEDPSEPVARKAEAKPDKPAEKTEKAPIHEQAAAYRKERREFKQKADGVRAELDTRERKIVDAEREIMRRAEEHVANAPAKYRKMFLDGQLDEVAKEIFGMESWEKAQEHSIRLFSDPAYKHSRKLEDDQRKLREELTAEREATKKRETEWQQEQSRLQSAANERAAISKLGEMLKASEDGAVSRLAEKDPNFTIAVLREIQRDDSLDVDEAAQNVREKAAALRDLLDEAFGVQTPSKSEVGKPTTPVRAGSQKQPVKPQKHVSRTTASEASPPADEELSNEQWQVLAVQEMKNAARTEAESRRQR